jgi:hypothetical protein
VPKATAPRSIQRELGVSCKCEERSSGGVERFAASKLSCSARNMQLSDCENPNGFWEDADGRQLDCQLRMLKRLVEGLQAEVHALRLEKEQDYGRFSGDIADHGQRIKSLEGKRDSVEELQDKARKLADYMDDVKVAKFAELRGKFKLSKSQLNRVIAVMMDLFPDRYEVARCATDGLEFYQTILPNSSLIHFNLSKKAAMEPKAYRRKLEDLKRRKGRRSLCQK